MLPRPRNIVVLGSTGSIGRSTLEVVESAQEKLRVVGLSAHRSVELLLEQAVRHKPRWIAVTDPAAAGRLTRAQLPPETELLVGPDAVARMVSDPEVDMVVSAIVGSAGLWGTWAALEAGKTVALANKESLVMAGRLVTDLAAARAARLLPVDSEHSAVFQALQAGRPSEVRRVVLTASGGPFLTWSRERLATVTVADALAHPTWNMGPKITIDSATLMNKALEIIEARWLFDLGPEQIGVVIHPQSIVHSLVEFVDGSIMAQMSPPDMKLPIHYALSWPERSASVAARLDWSRTFDLHFEPPDLGRFAALELGLQVARSGGTAGAVLNGANEAAVAAFLGGRLGFPQIVPACRAVLEHHHFEPRPTLERILELDRWAREEVSRWISTC